MNFEVCKAKYKRICFIKRKEYDFIKKNFPKGFAGGREATFHVNRGLMENAIALAKANREEIPKVITLLKKEVEKEEPIEIKIFW